MSQKALEVFYPPPICSLWKAPNRIWPNNFASNKLGYDLHPAIISEVLPDGVTVKILPGTSKSNRGKCVFRTKLNQIRGYSFFLFFFSMTYSIEELSQLKRGWNGIMELSKFQRTGFFYQMYECEKMRMTNSKDLRR